VSLSPSHRVRQITFRVRFTRLRISPVALVKFGPNRYLAIKEAAKPRAFEVIRQMLVLVIKRPGVQAWLRAIRAEFERRRQAEVERRRRYEEQLRLAAVEREEQRRREAVEAEERRRRIALEEERRRQQKEEERRRRAEVEAEQWRQGAPERRRQAAEAHRRRKGVNLGADLDRSPVDEEWTLLSDRPCRGQYLLRVPGLWFGAA
jgi:dTMP kinase